MKLFNLLKTFRDDDSGAVTVDWVVLTAAIVGLGIAVIAAVSGGVNDLAGSIESALTGADVNDLDGLDSAADAPEEGGT